MTNDRSARAWSRAFAAAATLTIAALAFAPSAPAGDLPSVEQVLEKHAAAIGGEAVEKAKNRSSEFDFAMPMQGVYASGVEYWQHPGQHHTRIELASMGVSDFEAGVKDGTAWQVHPMAGTRKLSGEEAMLALRGASLNPYAGWNAYFEKAEVVGEEPCGEATCYKVEFSAAGGSAITSFFDKETGLVVREEFPLPNGMVASTEFSDWEETQGITSARTVKIEGPESYKITYTSVAYDVEDLPQEGFETPASLQEAPAAAPGQ